MTRYISKRQSVKNYIAFQQAWRCKLCNTILPFRFELDHVIPLHQDLIQDRISNLQALCTACHSKKTFYDMQFYWDQKREEKTGISKYFNPECFSYLIMQPRSQSH